MRPGLNTCLLAILLPLCLAGCSEDIDEATIRSDIFSMGHAIEDHDMDAFIGHLAEDYHDGRGLNKEGIRRILDEHFSRNPNIHLVISELQIELDEGRNQATVKLRVLTTGGEGALPERGRLSAINSKWQRQADGWRVLRADWRPVLLQLN